MKEEWEKYLKKLRSTDFIINKFIHDKKAYELREKSFLPFFYFIGMKLKIKNIIEIGSSFGMKSGALILAGSSPDSYFCYDDNNNLPSTRMAKKNLYQFNIQSLKFHHYSGRITMMHDHISDLLIINNKDVMIDIEFFNNLFKKIEKNGSIIIDYPEIAESTRVYLRKFSNVHDLNMLEFNNKNKSILIKV